MIVSVSRRTDIPAFFFNGFLNDLTKGYCDVPNPYNSKMVRRVSLKPEDVDAFVFWSKNPLALLGAGNALANYAYYVQYTLNGYGKEIESGVPEVDEGITTFLRLSDMLGAERVRWRYDPILLGEKQTAQWHLRNFAYITGALKGKTESVTISFVDNYRSSFSRMKKEGLFAPGNEQARWLAKRISDIAAEAGMRIYACAEAVDFSEFGVARSSCVDAGLISRLSGKPPECFPRDKNQRPLCLCAGSVDVGAYDTCLARCAYCYATRHAASKLRT